MESECRYHGPAGGYMDGCRDRWIRGGSVSSAAKANPVPRDSDFMPNWALSGATERRRIRERLGLRHGAHNAKPTRNRAIVLALASGATLKSVGSRFGISAGRVDQIQRQELRRAARIAG